MDNLDSNELVTVGDDVRAREDVEWKTAAGQSMATRTTKQNLGEIGSEGTKDREINTVRLQVDEKITGIRIALRQSIGMLMGSDYQLETGQTMVSDTQRLIIVIIIKVVECHSERSAIEENCLKTSTIGYSTAI